MWQRRVVLHKVAQKYSCSKVIYHYDSFHLQLGSKLRVTGGNVIMEDCTCQVAEEIG